MDKAGGNIIDVAEPIVLSIRILVSVVRALYEAPDVIRVVFKNGNAEKKPARVVVVIE